MECEKIQNCYLELDNGSRMPLSVQIHTLFCGECRRLIARLNDGFESLYSNPPVCMERDLSEKIMSEVFGSDVTYEHHVSGLQWAVVGLVILTSMVLIPFSDSFGWLRYYFGAGLELPVNIALGVVISIYATAGIFSNLEFLKKFIHDVSQKLH